MDQSKGVVIDRAAAAAVKFVSRDESRGALRAVRVTREFTESTNGHVLARIPLDKTPAEDFPVVEGAGGGFNGQVLVPVEIMERAIKAGPRKSTMRVLEGIHVGETEQGAPVCTVTDLESPTVVKGRKVEGNWPNVERVIPKADKYLRGGYDAKYIGWIADFAKRYGNATNTMIFHIEDKEKAARIEVPMANGGTAIFVLMPVRVEG